MGQSQTNVTNGFDLHGKVVNKVSRGSPATPQTEQHRCSANNALIQFPSFRSTNSSSTTACAETVYSYTPSTRTAARPSHASHTCVRSSVGAAKRHWSFCTSSSRPSSPPCCCTGQLQRCVQYCQMVVDGENEPLNEDPLQAINSPLQRWLPTAAPSSLQAANPLQELLSNTYINTFLHLTPAGQPAQCSHPRTVRWIDAEIPTASLIRIAGRGYNHLQLQTSNKRDSYETPQSPQKRPPTPLTNKQQSMAASPQQPLRNITNLQHSVPSPQSNQRSIVSSYATQQPTSTSAITATQCHHTADDTDCDHRCHRLPLSLHCRHSLCRERTTDVCINDQRQPAAAPAHE